MAITYPRAMPAGRWMETADFTLGDMASTITHENGAIATIELGEPLWSATFRTFAMEAIDRQMWQAWGSSLRNGRTFLGFDPEKEFPAAYGEDVLGLTRAGGGAFDGTGSLSAWTATGVTISTLPAGYKASAGDMLSFPWAGVRALHMVMEDATANGSGVVTVAVDPPVRLNPLPVAGSPVALIRPPCVMQLKPGTFSAPGGFNRQPVSFEAVQKLI